MVSRESFNNSCKKGDKYFHFNVIRYTCRGNNSLIFIFASLWYNSLRKELILLGTNFFRIDPLFKGLPLRGKQKILKFVPLHKNGGRNVGMWGYLKYLTISEAVPKID